MTTRAATTVAARVDASGSPVRAGGSCPVGRARAGRAPARRRAGGARMWGTRRP